MKILYGIVAIFLIFLTTVEISAEDFPYATQGYFNGRYWNILTHENKKHMVLGIWDGIIVFTSIYPTIKKEEKLTQNDQNIFSVCEELLLPLTLTDDEIVTKIDKFYEDEFNRVVPIWEAYRFICFQFSSASDKKVEFNEKEYIRDVRNKYAK